MGCQREGHGAGKLGGCWFRSRVGWMGKQQTCGSAPIEPEPEPVLVPAADSLTEGAAADSGKQHRGSLVDVGGSGRSRETDSDIAGGKWKMPCQAALYVSNGIDSAFRDWARGCKG